MPTVTRSLSATSPFRSFRKYATNSSWRLRKLLNYTEVLQEGDVQLRIPIRGLLGHLHMRQEGDGLRNVLRIARTLNPKADTLVDVGANLGQALIASQLAGVPRYLGFEPGLEAAAYVHSLIRENRLTQASILPIALGDRNETVKLHSTVDAAFVGATLNVSMTPAQMYSATSIVKVTTGDLELSSLRPGEIALVKIDVEGHEEAVLRGMRETILRTHCPIYCEVLGYDHFIDGSYGRDYFGTLSKVQIQDLCDAREQNGLRVTSLLQEFDYQLFEVDGAGNVSRMQPTFLSDSRPGKQGERNVLAIPSELACRL